MMSESSAESNDFISSSLIDIIIRSRAYEIDKDFIDFDVLWEKPQYFYETSCLITKYIQKYLPWKDISGILALDSVVHPFGSIPIASLVSQQLNLPLGIVKECDDPLTGSHRIYGACHKENSLILYDVLDQGLTALRMLGFLTAQKIQPRWILTVVDCNNGARKTLSELNQKIEMIKILDKEKIIETLKKAGWHDPK